MAAAGVMFEIGGIILAAAMNYEMLIIGRCFLGVAVSPTGSLSSGEGCSAIFVSISSSHCPNGTWLKCSCCVQISFASVSVPMYNRWASALLSC